MERFLEYFVPEYYFLEFNIRRKEKKFEGRVEISGAAKAETVKFHAVSLSIDYVKIDGEEVDFSHEDGVLTLSKVSRSDLEVEIGYHGSLNENSGFEYATSWLLLGW